MPAETYSAVKAALRLQPAQSNAPAPRATAPPPPVNPDAPPPPMPALYYGRDAPSEPITFDTSGWTEFPKSSLLPALNNETAVRAWVCPGTQDLMMLQHFNLPPDIGGPLSRPAELKAMLVARRQATGGGLIDCQVKTYDGVQCLQRIEKNQQRVGPESDAVQGMTYSGSLIVPRRDFSYVVMIHCREDGTTGVRESTLLATCGHEERMRHIQRMITKTGPGPMDEGFEWDKEQYDVQFPDHPLSRVRRQLRALDTSLRVSAAVKAAPPFTGDPPPQRKMRFTAQPGVTHTSRGSRNLDSKRTMNRSSGYRTIRPEPPQGWTLMTGSGLLQAERTTAQHRAPAYRRSAHLCTLELAVSMVRAEPALQGDCKTLHCIHHPSLLQRQSCSYWRPHPAPARFAAHHAFRLLSDITRQQRNLHTLQHKRVHCPRLTMSEVSTNAHSEHSSSGRQRQHRHAGPANTLARTREAAAQCGS